MTVLVVGSTIQGCGGIERSLKSISSELLRAGCAVHLALLGGGNHNVGDLASEVRLWELPPGNPKLFRLSLSYRIAHAYRAMTALARSVKPDHVWTRQLFLAHAAQAALPNCRLTYVAPAAQRHLFRPTLSTRFRFQSLPKAFILHVLDQYSHRVQVRLERQLLEGHTSIVTFSENVLSGLVEGRNPQGPGRWVVAPGIDHRVFRPADLTQVRALAKAVGLPRGARVAVYAGRLEFEKNVDLLIESFAAVEHSQKYLVIVGSGGREALLRKTARSLAVSERVIFAGPQSEHLPFYYSLARVSVIPTFVEGFGQAHIEAMACGTPSIGLAGVGTHTATDEIIVHNVNGFRVDPPHKHNLTEALSHAFSLPEREWELMSAQARRSAVQYDWRRFVHKVLSLSEFDVATSVT